VGPKAHAAQFTLSASVGCTSNARRAGTMHASVVTIATKHVAARHVVAAV
jgi:hypothetical protein